MTLIQVSIKVICCSITSYELYDSMERLHMITALHADFMISVGQASRKGDNEDD